MQTREFNDLVVASDGAVARFDPVFFEHLNWKTWWSCEQWSEEMVEFVRRSLEIKGITHVPEGLSIVAPDDLELDPRWSKYLGVPVAIPRRDFKIVALADAVPSALLRHFREAEVEVDGGGNLLLNEGIQLLEDLLIGAGGVTATNANAQLGVGDSVTAEAATQTDLQAGANKLFVAMNATFPSRASQTLTFVSDFTSGQANYAWQEMSIRNQAAADKNINRKVTSLGTKATGTWTLTGTVAIS